MSMHDYERDEQVQQAIAGILDAHDSITDSLRRADSAGVSEARRRIGGLERHLRDLLTGPDEWRQEEIRRRDLYRAANAGRRVERRQGYEQLISSQRSPEERRKIALEALRPIRAVDIADVDDAPPDPVLRLKGTTGSLLALGESCIMSGDPGIGKSSRVLEWLRQRAVTRPGEWIGLEDGLEIRGGASVFMTWEDSPARMRTRFGDTIGRGVKVMEMRARHLWEHRDGGGSGPSPWWSSSWDEAGDACEGDGVAVIDPIMSSFAGSDVDASATRSFVDSATAAAAARGLALLMIGHPTKSARGVSGSIQWLAACRALLFLGEGQTKDDQGRMKPEVHVIKANYSPKVAPG